MEAGKVKENVTAFPRIVPLMGPDCGRFDGMFGSVSVPVRQLPFCLNVTV